MSVLMRRACRRMLATLLLLSAAASSSSCNRAAIGATASHRYEQNGVSLTLPASWEVIEDVQHVSGLRTIAVVTEAGSVATLDVYPVGEYMRGVPTLDEYAKA